MKTSLSIIVPVFQDTLRSQTLIQSLNAQQLSSAIEVIFCCTNVEEHQRQTLRQALHTPINVVVLESLHPGIGKARNLGIRTAQSEWLLFIDDDCALPHSHYIQNTINLTQSGHKAFCGTYLNAPNTPLLSAFYNYLSHLWLMSFQSHPQSSMLIGGCFLASKPLLLQQHAYFDEHNSLAGEEIPVAQKLLHNFTQIRFTPSLSVIHDTRCTTQGLFKKAWNHGRALTYNRSALPQKKGTAFLQEAFSHPMASLRFFPILLLFLFVGRVSLVWGLIIRLFSTTEKPFRKNTSTASKKGAPTQQVKSDCVAMASELPVPK